MRNPAFVLENDTHKLLWDFGISRCLPLDKTWHKVNEYNGDLGKEKVGLEPRLKACWSMLVIDSPSAMWVWWA